MKQEYTVTLRVIAVVSAKSKVDAQQKVESVMMDMIADGSTIVGIPDDVGIVSVITEGSDDTYIDDDVVVPF